MTPPDEDGEVALTYEHWMEVLRILQREDQSHNTQVLAQVCANLLHINRHDPETIQYMNRKAEHMLAKGETL